MGATKRIDLIPISRREFEAGRTGPEFTIINLLQRHSDRAFTALKILSDLGAEGYSIDLLSLQELLERLMVQREIESKVITTPEGQAMYYAYVHGVGVLAEGTG
jgi:hypothetical protein